MKIAHVVNPFQSPQASEHAKAQKITLDSMVEAASFGRLKRKMDVVLHSVHFQEDESCAPESFDKKSVLTRSVSDIDANCRDKKLPLLKDILDCGFSDDDVEYVVYTNIDIAVVPYFYLAIEDFIKQGIDAAVVNRRRISEDYFESNAKYMRYADHGLYHSGNDCFLIQRSVYEAMELGNVCIGIPHVGNTLLYNILAHSKSFKMLSNTHLTQHIGYDLVREWGGDAYLQHNKRIFKKTAKSLTSQIKIEQFPGSWRWFCSRHFRWLMNPTIHYPSIFMHDIKHLFKKRPKPDTKGMKGLSGKYYEWLQNRVRLE